MFVGVYLLMTIKPSCGTHTWFRGELIA